jgi:hypothetical protein
MLYRFVRYGGWRTEGYGHGDTNGNAGEQGGWLRDAT